MFEQSVYKKSNHYDSSCRKYPEDLNTLKEVFIGGLNKETVESDIFSELSSFGQILLIRLKKHKDGFSKGFAFVKFQKPASALNVLRQRTFWIRGKLVECIPALNPQESRQHIKIDMEKKIYVHQLSKNLNEQALADYFSNFGNVIRVRIVRKIENEESRGFGFVLMSTVQEAQNILHSTHSLDGKRFQVRRAISRFDMEHSKQDKASSRPLPSTRPLDSFSGSLQGSCSSYPLAQPSLLEGYTRETSLAGILPPGEPKTKIKLPHKTTSKPSYSNIRIYLRPIKTIPHSVKTPTFAVEQFDCENYRFQRRTAPLRHPHLSNSTLHTLD